MDMLSQALPIAENVCRTTVYLFNRMKIAPSPLTHFPFSLTVRRKIFGKPFAHLRSDK